MGGSMPAKRIVTGQPVKPETLKRAQQLRQDMTPAERKLWAQLCANRLGGWHFRRQQIISGFIVDFYCHRAALVVEVDGPIHQQQQAADAERDTVLRAHGLRVLRFTNEEVLRQLPAVLEKILAELSLPLLSEKGPGVGSGERPGDR